MNSYGYEELLDEKHTLHTTHKSRSTRSRLAAIAVFLAALALVITSHTGLLPQLLGKTGTEPKNYLTDNEYSQWPAENEAFELRLPVVHPNLVHEQLLLEHTFADSWGKPATAKFYPPVDSVKYSRVILELNTTVDGVQYDRLAHVFINDIPVWRTSTAEPGNKLVFSSVDKDVSKYLTLFQEKECSLTVQLDNLVRGRLTGAFKTTLTAKYYNVPESPSNMFHHFETTSKPAQRVTQLIKPSVNRTPLLYYPADKLEFTVPRLPHNTTAAKIALYVSGNAAEEFWYSNVMEVEKNHFKDHGHHFEGHGPVRVVNTYLNNVLVSVDSPEPVIFTGGISPALWRPIVGVNAFDIKPLEIDLTGFLPELWEGGMALDFEITNGSAKGLVGSNWIIGANILSWESEEVETSFGAVESFTNSSKMNTFHITTDEDKFFEIVGSKQQAEVTSNLTFVLKNGTELPLVIHSQSTVEYSNSQQYYQYGDAQFLVNVISSKHETTFDLEDERVGQVLSAHAYPLTISILTEPISPPNVTYEANVTHVYGARIVLGGREVFVVESSQNGTSQFTLTPQGNYGHGATEHTFAAELYCPFPRVKGGAFAKAENGTLVEFDRKFKVVDEQRVEGEQEDADTMPYLIFGEFDPVSSHIRELVESGDMSPEAATEIFAGAREFKALMESREAELVQSEYVSRFPGFRAGLEDGLSP